MNTCEVCGNDYDKAFRVVRGGETHVFDCFECAIEALAPRCETCSVRIVGHGLEAQGGRFFCCDSCAERAGVEGLKDRV
jgi:hypothetical protein